MRGRTSSGPRPFTIGVGSFALVAILGSSAAAAPAAPTQPTPLLVDLSSLPTSGTTTFQLPTTGPVTFTLVNKLPGQDNYVVAVQESINLGPSLQAPTTNTSAVTASTTATAAALATTPECQALHDKTNALSTVNDERDVPSRISDVKKALPACQIDSERNDANAEIALTQQDTGIAYNLGANNTITVTITGPDGKKTWTVAYTVVPTGTWFSSYGFAFAHANDQLFFSKSASANHYLITREANNGGFAFAPTLFYSWFPGHRCSFSICNGFDLGLTAGLGFDLSNPIVLLGVIAHYNVNVSVIAGGMMRKEDRLNGIYQPGEIVTTNLDSSTLQTQVYRPEFFFGLSFRFGSSPFSTSTTSQSSNSKPAPTATPKSSQTSTSVPAPTGAHPSAGSNNSADLSSATTAVAAPVAGTMIVAPIHRPTGEVAFRAALDLHQAKGLAAPQLRHASVAATDDWPASLYTLFTTSDGTTESCTAALIGPQAMLTAAHCVPASGLVTFSYAADPQPYVASCTQHPDYASGRDASADYALCKVNRPFVPPSGFLYETVSTGSMIALLNATVTLTGFGCVSDIVSESTYDDKYRIGTNTIDETSASTTMRRPAQFYVPHEQNNLFTSDDPTLANLCPGDSGGPVFSLTAGSGRFIVGVNSRVFYRDATKSSYGSSLISATGGPSFMTWAQNWAATSGVSACGISGALLNCRT